MEQRGRVGFVSQTKTHAVNNSVPEDKAWTVALLGASEGRRVDLAALLRTSRSVPPHVRLALAEFLEGVRLWKRMRGAPLVGERAAEQEKLRRARTCLITDAELDELPFTVECALCNAELGLPSRLINYLRNVEDDPPPAVRKSIAGHLDGTRPWKVRRGRPAKFIDEVDTILGAYTIARGLSLDLLSQATVAELIGRALGDDVAVDRAGHALRALRNPGAMRNVAALVPVAMGDGAATIIVAGDRVRTPSGRQASVEAISANDRATCVYLDDGEEVELRVTNLQLVTTTVEPPKTILDVVQRRGAYAAETIEERVTRARALRACDK
jgi:hypothetical protein